jgi:tRNA wybutosine-synthesizing protein 1
MTMIREYNENIDFVNEFAEMMLYGNPHFIEVKSYMHIGMSTERLEKNNMIEMGEIRSFSRELSDKMPGFSIMDESEISRVVVLQNQKRYTDRWIGKYFV